ncbi:MAG: ATP--guanido phosphotransferase, partial [Aristaeellaceae bacterium]
FSPKLTPEYANEVIDRTAKSVFSSKHGASFMLLRMNDLENDARNRLVEHHLISYDLLKFSGRSAAMVSSAGTISVMMNEEDHVRFQGLLPGLQLERSAEMALSLDEKVGEDYPFAFDTQWGFLTACPANTGTGMRACVILHLPALAQAGQMGAVMQSVAKLGLTIRGMYGNGAEAQGQLYQMSNVATLGRSEEDVIRSLMAATEEIVNHERAMRENAEKKDMLQLQDALMRSWGETMHARLMTTKEFMRRYSDIRYAASLGYLHLPIPALDLLMMDLQPGSLGVRAGHLIGEREAEILRAKILREELSALSGEET